MAKGLCDPVIVIPGITGTYLADQYPLPPEVCWSVMRRMFDRVALHPDDPRYEAQQPSRLVPDQLFELVYKDLIQALRYELATRPSEPVPVFAFGYDWRQPLARTVEALEAFVDEVIDRTSLMRHYHVTGYSKQPRVNLVGHSMGGLIIAGYVARAGAKRNVSGVATLGTPYRGSFEAVLRLMTGTSTLGDGAASWEREAARLTPGVYHLLPRFKQYVPAGADARLFPEDFLDPKSHQPSIQQTLELYIDRFGSGKTPKIKLPQRARQLFEQEMLQPARAFRDLIESITLDDVGLKKRWLAIVGVGTQTRVRLRKRHLRDPVDYDLTSQDRLDAWGTREASANFELTGDGTVCYQGAEPSFLRREELVCVHPSDFQYFREIGDRVLSGSAGFHAMLCNLDLAHRLIVRHFTGRPDVHSSTWGRPGPGIVPPRNPSNPGPGEWDPPLRPLRPK